MNAIKLEVGKTYRTILGRDVKIVKEHASSGLCSKRFESEEGKIYEGNGKNIDSFIYDLVSVVVGK